MKKLTTIVPVLSFVIVFLYNRHFTYDYVEVQIDKGILKGFKTTTGRSNADYYAFKGIPYAKPPVGERRFKAPQEEAAWAGVRDALSHGNVCPHLDLAFGFLRGQEDCLYLNVYTPSVSSEGPLLPVMVWIHGGGFVLGSGNEEVYGSNYLLEAEVVLVTLNYRLGALGFLSIEDDEAPGNAGLKDQVAALRWVRRNIKHFGGDPERVTLFGESAGGASVHLHLLSPLSAGLFSQAIGQSGSGANPWVISHNVSNNTIRLAECLGAKNIDGDKRLALQFLKTAPYGDIIKIQSTLRTSEEVRTRVAFLYTPSVETGVNVDEAFLPDHPMEIIRSGKFNKVPYITGYTSHEGYLFMKELTKPETMNAAYEDTARYVPRDIKNEEFRNALGKSIRTFYFEDKPIGTDNISNLVDLYTDTTFVAGINIATKLQLSVGQSPIYFYPFSYDGGLNLLKYFFKISLPGAAHGDELGYLFNHQLLFWRKAEPASEDEDVMLMMVRLWTNFAKYGNPTPKGDWTGSRLEAYNGGQIQLFAHLRKG
uniref:Carboxylic ester hydrolase n=1 Tax=Athalia rosae TaxID=37344 RepID=Q59HJ2_ATHRO|nr:carboxylesterase [Athalia rosae]